MKDAFTSAPILLHFNPEKQCIVETDASDYVSAGILSQYDDDNVLHPDAFFSKKHSPAECNYEIYDKELMAIIRSFEEWRSELESSPHIIQVLSDHRNLEYFMSTKLLSRRQARWSEFLSRFNFKIIYRPGKAGGKPDSLTGQSVDLPKEGDEHLQHQHQTILKPANLSIAATNATETLETLFQQAYITDPIPNNILAELASGKQRSKYLPLAECTTDGIRLWFRERLYVPDSAELKIQLIRDHHDTPVAGHPGRSKTFELLSRLYFWPTMRKDVDRYLKNCHTCQRSRTSRHAPFGTLRPLPIPNRAWEDISMDFVVGLPWSDGFNAVLVVVCRLTKMRHFIPCRGTTSAQDLAQLYVNHVFRLHGLPKTITSDRGTQFVSHFWQALCRACGIISKLSTPYHPETNGQTERLNAVMEQYLRCYIKYLQDHWAQWLPLAEFATNNQASETISISPFFANYGFDPAWHFVPENATHSMQHPNAVDGAALCSNFVEITEHLKPEMLWVQAKHQDAVTSRCLLSHNSKLTTLFGSTLRILL